MSGFDKFFTLAESAAKFAEMAAIAQLATAGRDFHSSAYYNK